MDTFELSFGIGTTNASDRNDIYAVPRLLPASILLSRDNLRINFPRVHYRVFSHVSRAKRSSNWILNGALFERNSNSLNSRRGFKGKIGKIRSFGTDSRNDSLNSNGKNSKGTLVGENCSREIFRKISYSLKNICPCRGFSSGRKSSRESRVPPPTRKFSSRSFPVSQPSLVPERRDKNETAVSQ